MNSIYPTTPQLEERLNQALRDADQTRDVLRSAVFNAGGTEIDDATDLHAENLERIKVLNRLLDRRRITEQDLQRWEEQDDDLPF